MTKPTVTDDAVHAAIDAYEKEYAPPYCVQFDAMRAAITAAIEASGILDLIAKADAVLDHADAHCRAFPIATVPKDRWVDVWDRERDSWSAMYIGGQSILHTCYTHWRERRSWPPETPLPAVFTDLGAALERLKSQP
jgi:hypothetical protein